MTTAGPVRVAAGGRDNNFTVLRWVAAFAVLVSHSFPLAIRHKSHDLLDVVTGHELGWYAVNAFFVVSGFLVTKSLWSRRSLVDFLRARALRIFPALLVMLVVVVGALGLWFGALPLADFWRDERTWSYVVGNATLLGTHYETLPGVFGGKTVNGSLWTLPSEVFCYLLLAVAGALGAAASRTRLWAFMAVAFAGYLFLVLAPETALGFYPSVFPPGGADLFPRLGFCFLLGVVYFQIHRKLPLRTSVMLLLWGLVPFAAATPFKSAAISVALAYSAFWFAFLESPLLAPLQRMPDYSYGIYIYAFPVQKCVYDVWPRMTPYVHIAVAGAVTIVLAGLSWHLVEEPALRHVRRFRESRRGRELAEAPSAPA